jgi:GTP-binding protein
MFIDSAKIYVKAGNGGDGSVSLLREKYVAAGGPDGGDGGRGGNIIFKVDNNMSTLADFRYKRKYVAGNGERGMGKKCFGKSAEDLIIRVPRGTLVKDAETNELIADMSDDTPQIIAKGGRGGWGNVHFATSTRQTPRFARAGTPGEERTVLLELKLLADVGLVGYPNVGKSTLISVISEAKPNIANYHFTTLTPVLGVVRRGEGRSFVVADIPGLIEGASKGAGLGHEFLRHIERCRLLVHIVDVSGSEGRDPKEDFANINNELSDYDPELCNKPMIVAGNKCDLADDKTISEFRSYVESMGFTFFPITAVTSEGVTELLNEVEKQLQQLPPVKVFRPVEVNIEKKTDKNISVTVDNNIYNVTGEWIENFIREIDPDDEESLKYFQNVMMSNGIIDELRKKGIHEGDTVKIGDLEFEFLN